MGLLQNKTIHYELNSYWTLMLMLFYRLFLYLVIKEVQTSILDIQFPQLNTSLRYLDKALFKFSTISCLIIHTGGLEKLSFWSYPWKKLSDVSNEITRMEHMILILACYNLLMSFVFHITINFWNRFIQDSPVGKEH